MTSLDALIRLHINVGNPEHKLDGQFLEFSNAASRDAVSFSEREQELLALWDQLSELRLEHELIECQEDLKLSAIDAEPSSDETEIYLRKSERGCLEARAGYLLRNSIVEGTLLVDPLLKAVHSGANANPAQRALHPLIDERDVLSIAHANLSTSLRTTLNTLTTVRTQNIILIQENKAFAASVLDLANSLKVQEAQDIQDVKLRSELETIRAEIRILRRRWRIMKSVVAAVVVGSGIDWAREDGLLELVLDDEG